MPNLSLQDQTSEFLLYTAPNGDVKVEVLLSGETIWLTQKRIAQLFGVGVPAISKHLDNIYDSGELQREATISILETVQQEGKREVKRKLEYYNLDAVISVGYRVNSAQATQFRIWATQLIKTTSSKALPWMMSALKMAASLVKITLKSYWNAFAPFVPVSDVFTNKSPIFLLNAVLITILNQKPLVCFMLMYKTNFTSLLQGTQQRKSSH